MEFVGFRDPYEQTPGKLILCLEGRQRVSWGIAGSRLSVGVTGFVTHSYCVLVQLSTQNSSTRPAQLAVKCWTEGDLLLWSVLALGNACRMCGDVNPELEAIHSLAKIFLTTSAASRKWFVFYKSHLHINYRLNCEEERS